MTEGTQQPAGGSNPPSQAAPEVPSTAQPAWPPPPAGTQAQPAWPPPPAGTQAQPAWPPPPAGTQAPAAWPPAAAGAMAVGPTTSVLVVLAGIFLLIVGILTFGLGSLFGLLGGLLATAGTSESGLEVFGPIGGLVAGLAFLVVFWGLLEIIASIGMFIHRGWGRALGLIVGVVGVAFMALALVGTLTASESSAGGTGFSLVLAVGYGFTVLALVTGGEHFRRHA
jgi:hypothetical protein